MIYSGWNLDNPKGQLQQLLPAFLNIFNGFFQTVYFHTFLTIIVAVTFFSLQVNAQESFRNNKSIYLDKVVALGDFPIVFLEKTGVTILTGIENPNRAGDSSGSSLKQAIEFLSDHILGKQVLVHPQKAQRDIFGRLPVYLKEVEQDWINEILVKNGMARVQSDRFTRPDLSKLYRLEGYAREKKQGFWKSEEFEIWNANDYKGPESGYQIIVGRVVKISDSRNFFYINFGENWRKDFTAAMSKLLMTPEDKKYLKTMTKNSIIEVRGVLRKWNGPFLELYSIDHIRQVSEYDKVEAGNIIIN